MTKASACEEIAAPDNSLSAASGDPFKVRAQGYAINDQELEIGLRSIAVPIMSINSSVTAALNVGVQAGHVPLNEMTERILPILLEGAQELSLPTH